MRGRRRPSRRFPVGPTRRSYPGRSPTSGRASMAWSGAGSSEASASISASGSLLIVDLGFQDGGDGRLALEGGAELLQVHVGHPLHEVESRVVGRCRAHEDSGSGSPVPPGWPRTRACGARRRRHHEPEALQPEMVCEGLGVVGCRSDATTGIALRSSVARPVIGDPADPAVEVDLLVRMVLEPASRSPVVVEDGRASRVADLEVGELQPVRSRDRSLFSHRR